MCCNCRFPYRVKASSPGQFASKKIRRTHSLTGSDIKCSFTAGGLPAVSPDCSRVVEALCLRLCQKHDRASHNGGKYASRWKLIVSEYNYLRVRMLYSSEELDFLIPPINENTLKLWHKHVTRRDQVRTLLQGESLRSAVIEERLPVAASLLPQMPEPSEPLLYADCEDGRGLVEERGAVSADDLSATLLSTPVTNVTAIAAQQSNARSRTSKWRDRVKQDNINNGGDSVQLPLPPKRPRKEYCCSKCGAQGHTQYKGKRYCPKEQEEKGIHSLQDWRQSIGWSSK